MNTPTRLAVFATGLLVAFAAAWGVGTAMSPVLDEPVASHDMETDTSHDEPAAHLPGGLMVSQDGYTLALDRTTFRPGSRPLAFTITGPDGRDFTWQRRTAPRRYRGLPRFVTVRGGEYFFLPSVTALRFLSDPGSDSWTGRWPGSRISCGATCSRR